jgi:hypothetical protein
VGREFRLQSRDSLFEFVMLPFDLPRGQRRVDRRQLAR